MESLILESYPAGESDSIVVLLTRDGRRITARAKGVREMRSRLRAGLVPGSVSDVKLIPGRGRFLAASATPRLLFTGLSGRGPASSVAGIVLTLLSRTGADFPDERLFPEAVRMLRDIHTAALAGENGALLNRRAAAAWMKMLGLLGIEPKSSDIVGLSPDGVAAMRGRHIPKTPKDTQALLRHLGKHTLHHVPEARGALRWAWGGFRLSQRARFATMHTA